MQFKNILLAAAAAVTLTSGAALAAPAQPAHPIQIADSRWDGDHDRWDRDNRGDERGSWNRNDRDDNGRWDRDGRDDRGGWEHRDHRRYISNDRVYRELRWRGFRHVSAPYFYRGHYVVRAYDRRGRIVFVRVNPYTGNYLGISFRL